MLQTSQAYKQAIQRNTRNYAITVDIWAGGTSILTIDDANLLAGSFCINYVCGSSSQLQFGTLALSECSFSTINNVGKELTVTDSISMTASYTLFLEDGTSEVIPLGVYYPDDIEVIVDGIHLSGFNIKTSLLHKRYVESNLFYPAIFTDILNDVATNLEIEISYEGITLPNVTITKKPGGDTTFRDVLNYLAQSLGAFIKVDRFGNIVLFKASTITDFESTKENRSTYSLSSTSFKVTGLRWTAAEVFTVGEEGYVFDLSGNPFIAVNPNLLLNLAFDNIKEAEFTAFECSLHSDPSLEAGDILYIKDTTLPPFNSMITGITFNTTPIASTFLKAKTNTEKAFISVLNTLASGSGDSTDPVNPSVISRFDQDFDDIYEPLADFKPLYRVSSGTATYPLSDNSNYQLSTPLPRLLKDTSIAVRRKIKDSFPDYIFVAGMEGTTGYVYQADIQFPLDENLVWEEVISIPNIIQIHTSFSGNFVPSWNNLPDFETDNFPIISYITDSNELFSNLALDNCHENGLNFTSIYTEVTTVTAIRSFNGNRHSLDEGFLHYFTTTDNNLFVSSFLQERTTLLINEGINYTHLNAFFLSDYRDCVVASTNSLTDIYASTREFAGWALQDTLTFSTKTEAHVQNIIQNDYTEDNDSVTISIEPSALVQNWENIILKFTAMNIANDLGDKGLRISINSNIDMPDDFIPDLSKIHVSAFEGASRVSYSVGALSKIDKYNFILETSNFNNAESDISVLIEQDTLLHELDNTFNINDAEFIFTPTGLVPYVPEPPIYSNYAITDDYCIILYFENEVNVSSIFNYSLSTCITTPYGETIHEEYTASQLELITSTSVKIMFDRTVANAHTFNLISGATGISHGSTQLEELSIEGSAAEFRTNPVYIPWDQDVLSIEVLATSSVKNVTQSTYTHTYEPPLIIGVSVTAQVMDAGSVEN